MAGIFGLRAEDMEQVDALKRARLDWPKGAPMVRPSVKAPVLVSRDGAWECVSARFGFSRRFASINARSENLTESPMWRRYFGKSHALVPVSYVIEWLKRGDAKTPYLLGNASGGLLLAPALLGHHFEEKEDLAFAICTIPPNGFFSRFHDRMIAICPAGLEETWLRPEGRSEDSLRSCLTAPDEDALTAAPTSPELTKRKAGNWSQVEATGAPLRWAEVRSWPIHRGGEAP